MVARRDEDEKDPFLSSVVTGILLPVHDRPVKSRKETGALL